MVEAIHIQGLVVTVEPAHTAAVAAARTVTVAVEPAAHTAVVAAAPTVVAAEPAAQEEKTEEAAEKELLALLGVDKMGEME